MAMTETPRDADGNPLCAWCGGVMKQAGIGRPREYCRQTCRQRAWEEKHIQERLRVARAAAVAADRAARGRVSSQTEPEVGPVSSQTERAAAPLSSQTKPQAPGFVTDGTVGVPAPAPAPRPPAEVPAPPAASLPGAPRPPVSQLSLDEASSAAWRRSVMRQAQAAEDANGEAGASEGA